MKLDLKKLREVAEDDKWCDPSEYEVHEIGRHRTTILTLLDELELLREVAEAAGQCDMNFGPDADDLEEALTKYREWREGDG